MSDTSTIWKAVLQITDVQVVKMPAGATVLSADVQDGSLCIWFLCDPIREVAKRKIRIAGTGHHLESTFVDASPRFINTVLMPPFVWHVFDCGEVAKT